MNGLFLRTQMPMNAADFSDAYFAAAVAHTGADGMPIEEWLIAMHLYLKGA